VGGTGKFITVQPSFILFPYFECKSGRAYHLISSNTVTKSGRSPGYSVENRLLDEQPICHAGFPMRIAAHHPSNVRAGDIQRPRQRRK
jgi:hypothetical protein